MSKNLRLLLAVAVTLFAAVPVLAQVDADVDIQADADVYPDRIESIVKPPREVSNELRGQRQDINQQQELRRENRVERREQLHDHSVQRTDRDQASSNESRQVRPDTPVPQQDEMDRNASWRFKHHQGEWWYWTVGGDWMYHRDGEWHRYDATTFNRPHHHDSENSQAVDHPVPSETAEFYSRDDAGRPYYVDGGVRYYVDVDGHHHWRASGPHFYEPGQYYRDPSGRRFYYENARRYYYDNDGRYYYDGPHRHYDRRFNDWTTRSGRRGADVGAAIGGAIGGRDGAGIGAAIGVAIGESQ